MRPGLHQRPQDSDPEPGHTISSPPSFVSKLRLTPPPAKGILHGDHHSDEVRDGLLRGRVSFRLHPTLVWLNSVSSQGWRHRGRVGTDHSAV